MKQQLIEACVKCGRTIGQSETPFVYQQLVVCRDCHEWLTISSAEPQTEARHRDLPPSAGGTANTEELFGAVVLVAVGGAIIYFLCRMQAECCGFIGLLLGGGIIVGGLRLGLTAYGVISRPPQPTPEERATGTWGEINPKMICSHCQAQGQIRTKIVDRKKGVSGAKATGAILTGGISLLATGLSRKEHPTQAHCDNCNNTWEF